MREGCDALLMWLHLVSLAAVEADEVRLRRLCGRLPAEQQLQAFQRDGSILQPTTAQYNQNHAPTHTAVPVNAPGEEGDRLQAADTCQCCTTDSFWHSPPSTRLWSQSTWQQSWWTLVSVVSLTSLLSLIMLPTLSRYGGLLCHRRVVSLVSMSSRSRKGLLPSGLAPVPDISS